MFAPLETPTEKGGSRMSDGTLAAMREALEATLQSHERSLKAQRCTCSLCLQIRDALAAGAGDRFADRLREECAGIADWRAEELRKASLGGDEALKRAAKVAREIGDRIRALRRGNF